MAYEVIYKFHERLSDGKYAEEIKEIKKNVGKGFEEVSLEKLAAAITAQLARRDILIANVEILEFTKKPISFKEPSDGKGIIIKGKRFNFSDQGVTVELEDGFEEEEEEEEAPVRKSPKKYPPNHLANRASNNNRIISHMVFDPEILNLHEAKQKKLKFTVGKKYPIYMIEDHPLGLTMGQIFTTVDDSGKSLTVSDKFFVPANVVLFGENEVDGGFNNETNDIKLSYGNQPKEIPEIYRDIPLDGQENVDMSVPNIRRG